MKSDSVNKLRLSKALTGQSINQPKQQTPEAAQAAGTSPRGGDAVKNTVDTRLTEVSRVTGSGRDLSQIKDLVQSGNYLKETDTKDVAGAVVRDLF